MPRSFLWRISFVNIAVMAIALIISSYTIYNAACLLVAHLGPGEAQHNQFFNATLFQYLFVITTVGILISGLLQMHFTKRLVTPINDLIDGMKVLEKGLYPEPIVPKNENDEIGLLLNQFNRITEKLQLNEEERKKLVTNLSHEIRTPLTNLAGYLKGMEAGIIDPEPEMFRALLNETNRVTAMVEQLDHLSEIDHLNIYEEQELEFIQVLPFMEEVAALFRVKLEDANIELQIRVDESEVYGNRQGLQQILFNLVDNAINYYEGQGPIFITGYEYEDLYEIAVSGPGQKIKSMHVPYLFDRFYRTDESRSAATGGRGLGLAIANELAIKMSGSMTFEESNGLNHFIVQMKVRRVE